MASHLDSVYSSVARPSSPASTMSFGSSSSDHEPGQSSTRTGVPHELQERLRPTEDEDFALFEHLPATTVHTDVNDTETSSAHMQGHLDLQQSLPLHLSPLLAGEQGNFPVRPKPRVVSHLPGEQDGQLKWHWSGKRLVSSKKQMTVVHTNNHSFTRYHSSRFKMSFRCNSYRSSGCKARLLFIVQTNTYKQNGEHTCRAKIPVSTTSVVDMTEQMKAATDEMALARMDKTPQMIGTSIRGSFCPRGLGMAQTGLTQEQVIRRVHSTRRNHFGADIHGVVEVPSLSVVPETADLPFFQFYNALVIEGKLERQIGWAHPSLMRLLKFKRTTVFIDGTFRCVPRGFAQCIVVMVHDNSTDVYVPVFYSVTTSRTQEIYWHLLHSIVVACDHKIQPATVVSDFESSLLDAVRVQFPEATQVGCFFHFKQACRRKMKQLGIPDNEVRVAMSKGYLDMLTVIPRDQIKERGIRYVRQRIQEPRGNGGGNRWTQFWQYFKKMWLKTYGPEVWNAHGVSSSLISRTSNPLKRFNREINAAVGTPHPMLPSFVSVIFRLSKRYVDLLDDIIEHRAKKRHQRALNVETVDLSSPIEPPSDSDNSTDEGELCASV